VSLLKRTIPAFAVIFAWTIAAWAAPPATLTTLRAIHDLSNDEANKKLPVAFEATVTYYRGYEYNLFVQDNGAALFVFAPPDAKLAPGDRVLIKGTTEGSYHPIVRSSSISVLGHGALPKAVPVIFDQLSGGQHDCEYVSLRGVLRSAYLVNRYSRYSIWMQVATDGGIVEALVNSSDIDALNDLQDAEVEVTGIAGGKFDGKMELRGIMLHVSSVKSVKMIKPASASPWSLPVSPIEDVFSGYHVNNLTRRVLVRGIITYYLPGSYAVLQSGDKSIQVFTLQETPLHLGHQAEVTGFPDVQNETLCLTGGEIHENTAYASIVPKPVTRRELTSSKNELNLVSIEGQVVMELREESQDQYVLYADGYMFSAIFRHANRENGDRSTMKQVPLGSMVRVTGICMLESANPFAGDVPFNLLMRSPGDISVVAGPTLLNVRNLVIFVGLLLVVVALVSARGWSLERKMRQKTAALAASVEAEAALQRQMAQRERQSAQIEHQRSHILQDINGSRPLNEILQQIAEMVSSMLEGAPCWCELSDGTKIGNCPDDVDLLRVVRSIFRSRSGSAPGSIAVALDAAKPPESRESVALQNGAQLSSLAIETRRLYSDLRRRSEFDLLTEIPNRFAMKKRLDAVLEEAQQFGRNFGIIYIDLDKFKPINDRYGHHVGDLYLQEVALRMKSKLRSGDMLARLGGDEFAALISAANSRAEMEVAVQRLENCFDESFIIEGHLLHGAASIGFALYPEDGATIDNMLSAADAAMYAVKNRERPVEQSLDQTTPPETTSENRESQERTR
jgi:diguanylate cyclase (GGDEF)-like protein